MGSKTESDPLFRPTTADTSTQSVVVSQPYLPESRQSACCLVSSLCLLMDVNGVPSAETSDRHTPPPPRLRLDGHGKVAVAPPTPSRGWARLAEVGHHVGVRTLELCVSRPGCFASHSGFPRNWLAAPFFPETRTPRGARWQRRRISHLLFLSILIYYARVSQPPRPPAPGTGPPSGRPTSSTCSFSSRPSLRPSFVPRSQGIGSLGQPNRAPGARNRPRTAAVIDCPVVVGCPHWRWPGTGALGGRSFFRSCWKMLFGRQASRLEKISDDKCVSGRHSGEYGWRGTVLRINLALLGVVFFCLKRLFWKQSKPERHNRATRTPVGGSTQVYHSGLLRSGNP